MRDAWGVRVLPVAEGRGGGGDMGVVSRVPPVADWRGAWGKRRDGEGR